MSQIKLRSLQSLKNDNVKKYPIPCVNWVYVMFCCVVVVTALAEERGK